MWSEHLSINTMLMLLAKATPCLRHLASLTVTGHVRVEGLLLRRFTELHKVVDEVGHACLRIADSHGQLKMCQVLLGQAADCSVEDKEQWTTLHCAAKGGFLDFVVHPPTFKAQIFSPLTYL